MKFLQPLLFSVLFIHFTFSSFGQKEKEVFITNAQGNVHGTLTLPNVKGKEIPVALIIVGSGPTDRDGNSTFMKFKNIQMMSDSLVQMGITTLRYDKQGIGESKDALNTGTNFSVQDYIEDVKLWINFLENHKKLGEITLIGHSEGSFFAIMAAKEIPVKQVISIAGAGRTIDKLIIEQLAAQDEALAEEATTIFDSLRQGHTVKKVSPTLQSLFHISVQPYLVSWMKYDPSEQIKGLTCPVHVIQGDKDIQVPLEDAHLLVGENKHVELYVIEGMNHIFKKVEGDREANLKTYSDPTLPIMSELVDVLEIIFKK